MRTDEVGSLGISHGLVFTNAQMSARIKTLDAYEIDGKPAETQIWDIERLYRVCGSDSGREIIEINFKDFAGEGLQVINIPDTTWKSVRSFLQQRRLASPDELSALNIACQIPNKVPTSYQSQKALNALEKAKNEGFKIS